MYLAKDKNGISSAKSPGEEGVPSIRFVGDKATTC
jgi:hypothetical protein